MRVELITAPTVEPISLASAKTFMRVDPDLTDEDELIRDLITAAREQLEQETGRAFAVQTLLASFDGFPKDSFFTIATCAADFCGGRSNMMMPTGMNKRYQPMIIRFTWPVRQAGFYISGSWPSIHSAPGSVRVEYTAGYTATDGEGEEASEIIPSRARTMILYLAAHYYETPGRGGTGHNINRNTDDGEAPGGAVSDVLQRTYLWLIIAHRILRFQGKLYLMSFDTNTDFEEIAVLKEVATVRGKFTPITGRETMRAEKVDQEMRATFRGAVPAVVDE